MELPNVTLDDFAAALDKDGETTTDPFDDADVDLVVPEGVAVETDVALPLDVTVESTGSAEAAVLITAATTE